MHYRKDCYINDNAKDEGQDPRQQLEKFVQSNLGQINRDAILIDIPTLNMNDESWLNEFVRVNNPYTILETYFFPEPLKNIAVNHYNIAKDEIDVVGAILHELGFKRKVEPIGLFQIKQKLDQLQEDCKKMTEKVDEILRHLFLFYSYIMMYEASGEFEIVHDVGVTEETDKIEYPFQALEKLIKSYRKKTQKNLGDLYIWLKDLMELILKTKGFSSYCQLHYKCDVPLTLSQIAEIGMFRTYRNLVSSGHVLDSESWRKHKERIEGNLGEMDSSAREDWEANWNYVVNQYENQHPLPEKAMEQRMANFFKKFINLLSDEKIYPKVIVMRDYQVDAYGTTIINAVTSDPNETIVLTDCTNFDPFSEFYYHSRTNPVGIDPILVSKLDLDNWTILSEENQKEKENS
ncbi:MAG: hypothetical protein OXU36_14095 [Candidatus Poribacteria bacterium]|nr:hypothetical protein [Candidatus Poribacteria bacterium]